VVSAPQFTFGLDFDGNAPVKPHAVREAKGWRGEVSGLCGGTVVRVWQSPQTRERLAQALDDARKALEASE
jgi:hypothetical protein